MKYIYTVGWAFILGSLWLFFVGKTNSLSVCCVAFLSVFLARLTSDLTKSAYNGAERKRTHDSPKHT